MIASAPLELEISSLSHDGRGIAFLPAQGKRGKAIFVPAALPGQKVLCQPGKDHGTWQEAQLLEILDPAENISPPLCVHAGECGGCPLQAMPYDKQLFWKENILMDAMERIGGFERKNLALAWKGITPSPRQLAFRNKIELAFGKDASGRPFPGMRKRASHEIIPVRQCALVDDTANEIIRDFANLLPNWQWRDNFWRFLVLRRDQDEAGDPRWRILVICRPGGREEYARLEEFGKSLLAARPELYAFIAESRRDPAMIAKGEKRLFSLGQNDRNKADLDILTLPLGGRKFKVDAGAFFQVNDLASEKLAILARDADACCKNKNAFLDLYCGAGAPGLLLAPAYERSLGIELDPLAIKCARINAQNLPNCSFKSGDAARLMEKLPAPLASSISTVLMDPPRSGLDKRVLEAVLRIGPENIIMISCNPATLARDAKRLKQQYELKSLAGVDLFPHTPHVEACTLWSRK